MIAPTLEGAMSESELVDAYLEGKIVAWTFVRRLLKAGVSVGTAVAFTALLPGAARSGDLTSLEGLVAQTAATHPDEAAVLQRLIERLASSLVTIEKGGSEMPLGRSLVRLSLNLADQGVPAADLSFNAELRNTPVNISGNIFSENSAIDPTVAGGNNEQNFELMLEWNIAPKGNSGIFYRASENDDAIHWTAPEMQVLDDARHADGKSRLTAAGADYGLYPAPAGIVKPAGQWNQVRIIVNGRHVEHWLNGVRLLQYELWSPDWEMRVQGSKFAPHARYGRNAEGYIGLQDHGDRVAYRNIKIRVLP